MSQKEPSLLGHYISFFIKKQILAEYFCIFWATLFLELEWRCISMSKKNKNNNKNNEDSRNNEKQNNNNCK